MPLNNETKSKKLPLDLIVTSVFYGVTHQSYYHLVPLNWQPFIHSDPQPKRNYTTRALRVIFIQLSNSLRNFNSNLFLKQTKNKAKFNRFEFRVFPSRLVTISQIKCSVCFIIYQLMGGRIIGFIPFLRIWKMKTASSRI